MNTSTKKFAIIGNGFIASKHIEAIKAVGGEIIAICDNDPLKVTKDYPFYTDYKMAIKNADVVSLCTPNYLHTEMILEAARLCKTILSEKPMTFKEEELCLLKGVPNLFGTFQLRYLPEITEMRKKTDETVILKVEMKRSKTYHLSWKGDSEKTGGLLFNIGCHYFDLVGHLYGYHGFKSFINELKDTSANGCLVYENRRVHWSFSLTDEKDSYERSLTIGSKKFDLVQKENLHIKTYENLMWGQGTTALEEEKIIKMIGKILQHG